MKKRSIVKERVERHMQMLDILTMEEARKKAYLEQLKYLKKIQIGLLKKYGNEEGKKIFKLMIGGSLDYYNALLNECRNDENNKVKR